MVTGLIALAADIIALYSYFKNPLLQSTDLNVLLFILSLYFWVVLSWYYIRRGFLNGTLKNRYQRRIPVLRYALIGVGLLAAIINGGLTYLTQFPYILFQIAFYPIAYAILFYLLPVAYEEMRLYLTRLGVYTCKHAIWTIPTKEYDSFIILEGEKMTVISSYRIKNEIIPPHYYIKRMHQKGLVRYDDLLSNFKVSKASDK